LKVLSQETMDDNSKFFAAGTLLARSEEFRVVVHRFLTQNFQARAGADAGSRLVKPHVAITPDAQKLEVDSSGLSNGIFIGCAVPIVIAANGPVRNVDVAGIHVDMREEVFQHEMMKTPRMCGGKFKIFIKIKSYDARAIKRALF